MYHLWFLSPKNHISKDLINCLMLFPAHLHTVSSLWSTMWSKIHSHMLCSPLTSRAITALLSKIFFLQNWSWGYCAGCLAPGYSLIHQEKEAFSHTYAPTEKHRTNISSAVCIQQEKNPQIKLSACSRKKKIMLSNKQEHAWLAEHSTVFPRPSCPILASSHKHITGAVKVQLG